MCATNVSNDDYFSQEYASQEYGTQFDDDNLDMDEEGFVVKERTTKVYVKLCRDEMIMKKQILMRNMMGGGMGGMRGGMGGAMGGMGGGVRGYMNMMGGAM